MCTPPLVVSIDNLQASFRFPIINRRLNSQVDDFTRILREKSELPFNHIVMQWEKGQSTNNEIGQILSAVKDKLALETITLTIQDNNKLEHLFLKNLQFLIKCNQKSLLSFLLTVGKNCFQSDILSPLMAALELCQNLRNIIIDVDERNSLSKNPIKFQLRSQVQALKLRLTMENNENLQMLSESLNKSTLESLTSLNLSLYVKQMVKPHNPISMAFLRQCSKLRAMNLRTNSQLYTIQQCPQNIEKLSIKQAIHHHPQTTLQMLEKFRNLKSINELDLQFLRCPIDMDIKKELDIIVANNHLDRITLTVEYQRLELHIVQKLLQLNGKQVKIHVKIQKQCLYEQMYRIISYVVDKRVIIDTPALSLDISAKDSLIIQAIESQDATPQPSPSFPQIDVLKELAQKLNINCIVNFEPCMNSNYNQYRLELYMKLFTIKSQKIKLKISGQFELGLGSLLINIDDKSGKMLTMVMDQVMESPINKIIVYHHSSTEVRDFYKQLNQVFHRKYFLEFVNYVMYTQTRTPFYQKMVKSCQNQAEVYKRLVWQLLAIERRYGSRLCQWEMRNIQRASIKQFAEQ